MAEAGGNARRSFPACARVKRQQDFDAVYARGRRLSSATMVVIALENELAHNRLGLSVSRKMGGAPQRNRIKRRVREVFRAKRGDWPQGYDLVVIPRAGFPDSLAEVEAQLEALIKRLSDPGRVRETSP